MPPQTRTRADRGSRRPGLADQLLENAADAVDTAKAYLASEEGRRLREKAAAVVIIGAPLLSELPIFRRTPIGRLLRTVAIGTLIIKGAEWVRDWEPQEGLETQLA